MLHFDKKSIFLQISVLYFMREYFKLYGVILNAIFSLKLKLQEKNELFGSSKLNFDIFKAVTWFLRRLTHA